MKKQKNDFKNQMIQRATELLSSMLPRNTNWHSFAAREKAAEIVVEMILSEYDVKKKK